MTNIVRWNGSRSFRIDSRGVEVASACLYDDARDAVPVFVRSPLSVSQAREFANGLAVLAAGGFASDFSPEPKEFE